MGKNQNAQQNYRIYSHVALCHWTCTAMRTCGSWFVVQAVSAEFDREIEISEQSYYRKLPVMCIEHKI
jgi:hypothetical protein